MRSIYPFLLVLPLFVGGARPVSAVIFSGQTQDVRFTNTATTIAASWSAGWEMTSGGLILKSRNGSDSEWIETAPLSVGSGARLGTGFGGLVSVAWSMPDRETAERVTTSQLFDCLYRTSEDGKAWTNWTYADVVSCESGGCMSPRRLRGTSEAFEVEGNLTGPPQGDIRSLLLKHGVVPDPHPSNIRFQFKALPASVPRPPAGYLQVRLRPKAGAGIAVTRIYVHLSIVMSGIKP